jgi:two-component system, sensor histidine kinase and response regulator
MAAPKAFRKPPATNEASAIHAERRMKILLVDDTPENLVSLEAALSGLGEELVLAGSGKEALRHLLNDDFAAILLDVRMPDMDGFETAELIRARPRSRQTPILFLTGFRSEEHLFRGYDLGAVDFLFKPIVPEVLRSKVSVFVELSRGHAKLQEQAEAIQKLNADLEKRVLERTEELMRSNEELEQYAYIASHDLQEPLRTVSLYAQLLSKRYHNALGPDADQFIEFIVEGATRMEKLIHALLDFSCVDARGADFFKEASCDEALQDAIRNLASLIEQSGTVITKDSLPTVIGDPVQLTRLFQNMLVNSISYRREEPPRVHVTAEHCGAEWVIAVQDNGIGIEPQYAEKVFGIFRCLQPRHKGSGSGMGLAICKKIVNRHGGRIWVESALGRGATFRFTLPRIR